MKRSVVPIAQNDSQAILKIGVYQLVGLFLERLIYLIFRYATNVFIRRVVNTGVLLRL